MFHAEHFVPAIVYVQKCTSYPANLFFRWGLAVEISRAATGPPVRAFQTPALAKGARDCPERSRRDGAATLLVMPSGSTPGPSPTLIAKNATKMGHPATTTNNPYCARLCRKYREVPPCALAPSLGVRLLANFSKGVEMKTTKLLLICMCFVMIAPAVWGQTANSPAKPGILGFLDPATGAFRPVPAAAEQDSDAPATTTFTGTVTLTLTITLKTTGLTSITCTETVSVLDALTTGARIFSESNSVLATGTGTTRTCKLSIPYSWGLTTQASDNMTTGYSVVGTTGTTGLPQRTSTLSPLDTRKVPANGATTALTASVTL
jgi:hypothetical protein